MGIFKQTVGILILAIFTVLALGGGTMEGATASPGTTESYFQIGFAALESGDYDQAITDFSKALGLDSKRIESCNGRGLAYYNKGDIARAITDFETALSLDPNNADAKRYLAQAQQGGEMPTQQQGNQASTQQLVQAQQLPPEMAQGNSLAEKLAWLQAFAQSNGNYILEINADESIGAQTLRYSGKTNITITLRGIGRNRTISTRFEIGAGNTLVFENNITLNSGGVRVNSDSTFKMNDGSAITGGRGAGVQVDSNGTFIMSGGTISGFYNDSNDGGGVINGGTFIMSGGNITYNYSSRLGAFGGHGGGVYSSGTFTMSGGTISDNSTSDKGGGVYISSGAFELSGGIITGNSNGQFGGYQSGGGGVYVSGGTFTMSGGIISDNKAIGQGTNDGGGGVYIYSGSEFSTATFIMKGGTISENTSYNNGGGVYVYFVNGTFTMSGGTISENIALKNGGGVYVANDGTFNVSNGTISSNYSLTRGGGVFVATQGTFTKTGGIITGYTSDKDNGNTVIDASNSIQNFRGHAVFLGSELQTLKIKESTAGPGDNLSYRNGTASGAWDN